MSIKTLVGASRLFTVYIEKSTEIVIAAKDADEARRLAEEFATDALMDEFVDVSVGSEVTAAKSDWHGDQVVWSDDSATDGLTVKDVLAHVAENPLPSEEFGPVYWCSSCLSERFQWDWREPEQTRCKTCRSPEVTP